MNVASGDATPSGGGISGAAPGENFPLPSWLAAADHVANNTSVLKTTSSTDEQQAALAAIFCRMQSARRL